MAQPKIRLDHTHESGKVCFALIGTLDSPVRFRAPGGQTLSAAYRPYTGHWYVWDDDGKEIGSFRQELYDLCIRHLVLGPLTIDPDCVIQ